MATDLIRYDLLVQDALRGVVRDVLGQAAKNGLQGDHHYFITFKTKAPGLRLSNRMRQRYPEEMTVILQHQFWDLAVTEHAFEVGLSFGSIPERLLVPFAAITSFVDPSVQFGLKFDVQDEAAADEEPGSPAPGSKDETAAAPSPKRALAAVQAPDKLPVAVPKAAPEAKPAAAREGPKPAGTPAAADGEADAKKVVSIDAFRKKP